MENLKINWLAVSQYPDPIIQSTIVGLGARKDRNEEILLRLQKGFPELFLGDGEPFSPVTWQQVMHAYFNIPSDDGEISSEEEVALEMLSIPSMVFGDGHHPVPSKWREDLESKKSGYWPFDHEERVLLPATDEWPESVLACFWDDEDGIYLRAVSAEHILP